MNRVRAKMVLTGGLRGYTSFGLLGRSPVARVYGASRFFVSGAMSLFCHGFTSCGAVNGISRSAGVVTFFNRCSSFATNVRWTL